MTPEPKRRAVIYARVSLDLRDGAGVERQELECRQLVQQRGYELVEVCIDNSLSAYSGRPRPGFERSVELLSTGQADVLVAWHLDRITRQVDDMQRLLRVRNLYIDTVRGAPVDINDASAVLMGQLLTAFGSFESRHKGERVLAAQRAKAQKGELWHRLWGYEGGVVTEDARSAIPAMFDAFVRTHNIEDARRAFHELAPTAPWSRSAIRRRLEQPAYAGIVMLQGAELDVPAKWEALVTRETFQRVQAILRSPLRLATSHQRGIAQALGTGLYVCGKCGEKMMAGGTLYGTDGSTPAYRCRSNQHLNRSRQAIDTGVLSLLLWHLETANIGQSLLPRSDAQDTRAGQLAQDLDERDRRLQLLHDDYASGLLEPSYARAAIARLRSEVAVLREELASLGIDPDIAPRPYSVTATVLSLPLAPLRDLLAATMVVTLNDRRAGGARVKGGTVGLRPGDISVQWLVEPGEAELRGHHEVLDWGLEGLPLPPLAPWLADQLTDNGLTEAVRRRVWQVVAPYVAGNDWDVAGMFDTGKGALDDLHRTFG